MPNINIAVEIKKAREDLDAALAAQAAAFGEVKRHSGRIEALENLAAMIDSGKGNEAPPEAVPAPFSVIEGSGATEAADPLPLPGVVPDPHPSLSRSHVALHVAESAVGEIAILPVAAAV